MNNDSVHKVYSQINLVSCQEKCALDVTNDTRKQKFELILCKIYNNQEY